MGNLPKVIENKTNIYIFPILYFSNQSKVLQLATKQSNRYN